MSLEMYQSNKDMAQACSIVKSVHISIDDVLPSLRWASCNHPHSIWDTRFLGKLKYWHEKYNASFTLYVHSKSQGFHIINTPKKYFEELANASKWLKWGFHGETGDIPFEKEVDYKKNFFEVIELLSQNINEKCLTTCMRTHCFSATSQQVAFLKNNKIKTLLCADSERLSYDLDENESKKVSLRGFIDKNGMRYHKTHFRYENCEDISILTDCIPPSWPLIVFTHEWCFDKCVDRIEKSIIAFHKDGYSFESDLLR